MLHTQALLQLGARPDVKYRGQTPEEYAQRKNQRWGGYEEVLSIFEVVIPKTRLGLFWEV